MRPSAFVEEADQAASLVRIGGGVLAALVGVQMFHPWWNSTTDTPKVTPLLYVLALVGVVLAVYLLAVRVRLVDSQRLRWVVAGLGVAGTTLLFQAVVVAGLANVPELVTPSGMVALTWIRHAALAAFAFGAVLVPTWRRFRRGLVLACAVLLAAVLFEPTWELLPAVVETDGRLTGVHDWGTAITVVLAALAAVTYARACGRWAARPDVWVTLMLALAVFDAAWGFRSQTYPGWLWWNTSGLRAAPFLVAAAGLLADNARLLHLLRRHEGSLHEQLAREVDLAVSSTAKIQAEAGARARVDQVLEAGAFFSVFQPIVTIGSEELFAVEALTRFTAEPVRTPDVWFEEAHAVGRGTELELATLRAALTAARELPAAVAVSVNVSPDTLCDDRLLVCLEEFDGERPVIVEVTEHSPVDEYGRLHDALAKLRASGVRLAIDDAGAGFSSLRHVVRLQPELIKLDVSLIRDIHIDPVRHALAGSLVDFGRRTGTVLIAEGVEEDAELAALAELDVDAAQGYLLCRPVPVADLPAHLLGGTPVPAALSRGVPARQRLDASTSTPRRPDQVQM